MAEQLNIEYLFRLIYDLFHNGVGVNGSGLAAYLAHLWVIISYVGYVLSAIGLAFIIYAMIRVFELREREEHYYGTLLLAPEAATEGNLRWKHIEELAGGTNPSEWREAIIEADIMLHDVLSNQGYQGEGVAEKLRTIDQTDLGTLQDAWEAHRIRNQIAHEGSAFPLTQAIARKTVQRYGAVFREFGVI